MAIDISKFKTWNVLVIGDLILDEYIHGDVESIAKEAPVPVVTVSSDTYSLGGAGNIAHNLVSLGAKATVVGITGKDANARIMNDEFIRLGIGSTGVYSDNKRNTLKKTRVISSCQQILQIDHNSDKPVSTAAESAMITSVRELIPHSDIIIISDKNKGTLTRTFLTEIFSQAKKNNKITIVVPAGTHYEKYMGATILIPNEKDVARETGSILSDKTVLLKTGTELIRKLRIEGMLVTCGKKGVVLFGKSVQPFEIESDEQQVFDVTGAKDTMAAVLSLSLASGGSFKDAATVANVAAGIVIGKIGNATVSEKEIVLELMTYSGNNANSTPHDDMNMSPVKTYY